MQNPICYFLVGIPGSGKSKIAQDILKENSNIIWASSDIFIEKEAQLQGIRYDQVSKEFFDKAQTLVNQQIQETMKKKEGIIWDQTNIFVNARKRKLRTLLQNKYEVICLSLELSPDELQKRHLKRKEENGKHVPYRIIQDMLENYTRPSYEEGFSEIYIINDNNEYQLLPKPILEEQVVLSSKIKLK